MKTIIKLVLVYSFLSTLIGCSAIVTRLPAPEQVEVDSDKIDLPLFYRGTIMDIVIPYRAMTEGQNNEAGVGVLLLLDLPFSFVLDTLLLPYDTYQYLNEKQI